MLKKSVLGVLLITLLLITGCSVNGYEAYTAAAAKTNEATSGKFQFEMTLSTAHKGSEQVLPDKLLIRALSTFEDNGEKGIIDLYVFDGIMGYDSKYYMKSPTEHYLKLPNSNVYYLNALSDGQARVDKTVFVQLSDKWLALLKSENVFTMEDRLVPSENGDVKAKVYSVRPTSDQIRTLKEWFVEALSTNTEWHSYIGGSDKAEGYITALQNVSILSYEEEVSVDFDGYIIEETIKLQLDYSDTDVPIAQQQVVITKKHLERNTKVSLDFSPIDSGTTEPIEALTKFEK